MKTRTNDFINLETHKPEYSFQYECRAGAFPRWVYVKRDDGQPMRWKTQKQRDLARACFSTRREPLRALGDLKAMRLHLNQPGQAGAAQATTTTESHS